MDEVRFYRASNKPYGVFSNLYRRLIVFEGLTFSTGEHAYQYGKARKPKVRNWLMAAPSPALLAMAAHGLYPWDIAPGWSAGRYDRMRRVVEAKFRQHPDLAEILLATGSARIVETATTDNEVNRRWGEVNGVGQNWLGKILMEVRAALSEPAAGAGRAVAPEGAGAAPPVLCECPRCGREGRWTDGTDADYWCLGCGAVTPFWLMTPGASEGGRNARNL
jgi:ribA/ribD-fused uncharacterized protein